MILGHLTDLRFCCAPNVVTASEAREPGVYRVSSNRLLDCTPSIADRPIPSADVHAPQGVAHHVSHVEFVMLDAPHPSAAHRRDLHSARDVDGA